MFSRNRNTFSASIHWILFISAALAVAVSLFKYSYAHDYTFLIEAPCDPAYQECYVRDCENDYCPPNGLAEYRVFLIPAAEFPRCSDNSCTTICNPKPGVCKEVTCSSQNEIPCTTP